MTRTEPVRLYAIIAGLLTAAGGALIALGEGVTWQIAVGTAIIQLGVVAGGGELARQQAWAPATVDTLIDAETVIQAAQGPAPAGPDDDPHI